MSILKPETDTIMCDIYLDRIKTEWDGSSVAINIIETLDEDAYAANLTRLNAWDWFRLILMIDFSEQLSWLEKTILHGIPIDGTWYQPATGHQATVFDIINNLDGGVRSETRSLLEDLNTAYRILFLRRDVQPVLDILESMGENKQWISLNILLSMYVNGPLQKPRPFLHYIVTMGRYDMARGCMSSAQDLQEAFKSKTFLDGWMNMKNEEGQTVIHLTAIGKRESWARWFVSNSANTLLRDSFYKTPYHYAPCLPYLEIFNTTGQHNSDIMSELLEGEIPDLSSLKWILDHGGDPNSAGAFEHTSPEQMKLLVLRGGDPSVIKPCTSWSRDKINVWLSHGGICTDGFAELLCGSNESPVWICMLICLNNDQIQKAHEWSKQDLSDHIVEYSTIVKDIIPISNKMSHHKQNVEKLANMCAGEYI